MGTQRNEDEGGAHLFWGIMCVDSYVLALRFGGVSLVDLIFHACCLLLATLALARYPKLNEVPLLVKIAFGCLFSVALLQLVPMPPGLLQVLAPTKWQIMQTSLAMFPDIPFSQQITMIPQLHVHKLAVLALDFYAICLLCAAPAPPMRLIHSWLVVLAGSVSLLMIWDGNGVINEESLLTMYYGTFGGLMNQNHFACFLVMLIMPLLGQTLVQCQRLTRILQAKPIPLNPLLLKCLSIFALAITLVFAVRAFGYCYSRSGIIDLLLGVAGFFLGLAVSRLFKSRRGLVLLLISLGTVVLFTIPLGNGLEKYMDRGVASENRVHYIKNGLDYLSQGQLLGLGLGATEAVLDQRLPKPLSQTYTVQEYHNDFLQTLVEMGPLGLIGLGLLIVWVGLEARARVHRHAFAATISAAVLFGLALALIFHSAVSFPLRMTSIRLTALIVVFSLIKDPEQLPRIPRISLLIKLPVLLAALVCFLNFLPRALTADDANSSSEERSLRYARFFRVPLYQSGDLLEAQFLGKPTVQETLAEIPKIRALTLEHMAAQTYSVKGLTQLLILEVLESRLTNPAFDRAVFDTFKNKALTIREMGAGNNIHAISGLIFVYSAYADFITPEEKAEFLDLREKIKHDWDPVKQITNPPNTPY